MNIIINKNTGCYILHSLKDFVPEISKLRRMHILTSKQPSTQPSNTGIHCPYKISNVVWTYARSVYICSLSNAKSGGILIQLTSLMQTMIVPCIHYVCERILSIHIISTCVHKHSPKYSIHMIAQPLYIHWLNYVRTFICNM